MSLRACSVSTRFGSRKPAAPTWATLRSPTGTRTLRIVGKGSQRALIPLAPRTARAIGTAVGERTYGPLMARPDDSRLNRHAAGWIVRRLAKLAGSPSRSRRTRSGTPPSPPHWTPAAACVTCRTTPDTPTPDRPAATTAPGALDRNPFWAARPG